MWARGYCGDLFQSTLCAILCSWSWFLFVSITCFLADWEHLCGAGRQRVVMQSSVCLYFFFSPKTFTSSFEHSFQIQATSIKYLCVAACRSWFRGKKPPHTEKQALCVVGGIMFNFLPDALPSLAASAQVQTHCHGEPVFKGFHAFVIMQKEM